MSEFCILVKRGIPLGIKYSSADTATAGVTLMELIATLAIIALIAIGALSLYNAAQSSEAAERLISDAMATQTAVRQVYRGYTDYGNDSDVLQTVMWRSKRLPTTIKATVDESGKVSFVHHLGGKFALGAMEDRFVIVFSDIPSDVCIPMLSMTGSGWEEVTVGTVSDGVLNEFPPGYFPISPNEAATYCTSSDSMILGFYSRQNIPR